MAGSWGGAGPSLTMTITPYASATLKVALTAQLTCQREVTLFQRSFTPITFTIGPVPVVIVPKLSMLAGANLNVTAGLDLNASVKMDATLRGTATNKGLSTSFTGPKITKSATLTMRGDAALDMYAKAKITGEIYGVGGPYAVVKVGAMATADIHANPWWTIDGYVNAGLGVEINKCTQILLINWCLELSAGKDDLLNARLPIINAGGPYPGATPTPNPTPTSTATATSSPTPTPDEPWTITSAGGRHSCGLRTDGTAWCRGANWYGALGDGTTTDRHTPVQVGTATDWTSISAGHLDTRWPP